MSGSIKCCVRYGGHPRDVNNLKVTDIGSDVELASPKLKYSCFQELVLDPLNNMGETVLNLRFFDQDLSSIGVSTDDKCYLHDTQTLERTQILDRGVRILERISTSPLAIIVGESSARKLQIVNFATGREVCHFYFASSVIAVRQNKSRIVVLLEDKIYVHSLPSLQVVHIITSRHCNSEGIIDFCANSEKSLLVYPVSDEGGLVSVFDALNLKPKYQILAHESSVACLNFSHDGSLLATASKKGTLIRIWNTLRGTRLYEFRRGLLRNVSICSIVFSMNNSLVAVSSDTETVHIFKLPEQESVETVEDSSWLTWVKASLPTKVTGIFCEERAFAMFTLPCQAARKSCLAFRTMENQDVQIYVASFDGTLYIYSLNMQVGGECPLLKQQKFLDEPLVPKILRNYAVPVVQPSSPSALSESIKAYVPTVSEISGMVTNLLQSGISMFDSEQQSEARTTEEAGNKSSSVVSEPTVPEPSTKGFSLDLKFT